MRALFTIGLGIALYLAMQSRARAAINHGVVEVFPMSDPDRTDAEVYGWSPWEMDDASAIPGQFEILPEPVYTAEDETAMPVIDEPLPYLNPPVYANENLWAFLAMIRYAEGTAGAAGYFTLFGYEQFTDDSDHPANLGWRGVPLPDEQCRAAGFNPGCVTTAAGAYQIVKPTWNALRTRLRLPDFSPESQDVAALALIQEKGAIDDVLAGRFASAVNKVRKVWASLPGAGYAQPERSLERLAEVYTQNGGVIS